MTNNIDGVKVLARELLKKNAQIQRCVSYKDFANDLQITQPPVIATVTLMLEEMLEEDNAVGKPLLASLVIQKGKLKIPRSGFFEKLVKLNVIDCYDERFNEVAWHIAELKKLKDFYTK